MIKRCFFITVTVLLVAINAHADAPPVVTATNPANGALDVDASLTEISVTFDRPMMDKSWSWCFEDREKFPEPAGPPYYTNNGTTCVLKVKLQPGKEYVIWINTARFKNFKDKSGVSAEPYRYTFKTK